MEELPRRVLIAYGLPAMPAAMLGLPLLVHVPTFYAEQVGLGLALTGAVFLAARIWDVVTDPLVGALSDATRTPIGRRRPWMIAALPLVLVGVWFLFMPPPQAGATHLLVWTFVVYLGWTMMQIPHQAWGAELSDSYAGRVRVAAMREAFALVGVMLAASLPSLVALVVPGAGPGEALAAIATITIVLLPATGAIMLAVVPEKPPRRAAGSGWRAGAATLAANRPFRILIGAFFLNSLANGLPSTLFLLFVAHRLGLAAASGPLLLLYFLAALAGVPLAWRLARVLGKHRAWCTAMLVTCAAFVFAPLLPSGSLLAFSVICLITGLGLGADLVLPPAIQADIVDVDTAAGGDGRAGIYFALWGMATKLALALAVGIGFPLLEFAGFEARSATGLWALGALYAWVPVALKLAAIGLMWRFPLDEAEHARLAGVIRSATRHEQVDERRARVPGPRVTARLDG